MKEHTALLASQRLPVPPPDVGSHDYDPERETDSGRVIGDKLTEPLTYSPSADFFRSK